MYLRPCGNTKGYSSTYLAMGFANVRAGTWLYCFPLGKSSVHLQAHPTRKPTQPSRAWLHGIKPRSVLAKILG